LDEAGTHLRQAERQSQAFELFAEDLRMTQRALSRITGEFGADDLLGEIFSRFCIGK
jgi:tRNA modification GTPase